MSPLQVGRCNFLVEVDGESQHATKKPVSSCASPYACCNHVWLIIVKKHFAGARFVWSHVGFDVRNLAFRWSENANVLKNQQAEWDYMIIKCNLICFLYSFMAALVCLSNTVVYLFSMQKYYNVFHLWQSKNTVMS